MTTAPWWGVPVIAGSFLIIGALLGFYLNRLADKRKFDREDKLRLEGQARDDRRRWQEEYRQYGIRLLSAARALKLATSDLRHAIGTDEEDANRVTVQNTLIEIIGLQEEIELIGTTELAYAANRIYMEGFLLYAASSAKSGGSISKTSAKFTDAVTEFRDVMRREFHVEPIPPVPGKKSTP